ncbi:MAG TPA: response regulator [Steroidobacteraceae bacterium]|jgi:CheY-like chemotaxis protein|nr:response regulator [Steroidobacteraceae bacterium]
MKSPDSAQVLVLGDDAANMQAIVAELTRHFKHVGCLAPDPEAQPGSAQLAAEVLVLAFQELDQAQPYCRTIGVAEPSYVIQRTVLLCRTEDSPAALELCKRQYFDDYVAYWPQPQDRMRLPMSVWLAARAALALRRDGEAGAKLLTHAKQLGDLDRKLTHEINVGERQAATTDDSMLDLEHKLAKANDEFSKHLIEGGANAAVEIKDSEALKRDLAKFKSRQVDLARAARKQGVKPMSTWAQQLRGKVEPALAESRNFAAQVRQARPTLLVIGDDDTSRGLLTPSLRALGFDPVVARDGNHVLAQLARTRPNAILMDIVSSASEAVSLTRELKALPDIAHIPIIIVSGDSRRETLLNSLRAGASDFIAKPFTHEILRDKLGKILRPPVPA